MVGEANSARTPRRAAEEEPMDVNLLFAAVIAIAMAVSIAAVAVTVVVLVGCLSR
jgi:hypothetical protein